MEKLSSCPLCAGKSLLLKIESADHFFTEELFNVVECINCGLLFTNPRPAENEAGHYYESEEYLSHNQKKRGLFSSLYKIVRKYTIRKKANLIIKESISKSILDIGCGTGEFLYSLKEKGYHVKGIEPNLSARNFAKKNYNIAVSSTFNSEKMQESSVGSITMWHVLEHVYALNKTINGIKKVITNNGTLIVALPNPDSYDANHYKKYWAAYDLPRHLYHFKKENVKQLFEKEGFELIKIKPMYFDAFYVSLLSEKYVNGSMNYLKAIYVALVSNLNAFLGSKNYSSLIYIFKIKKG